MSENVFRYEEKFRFKKTKYVQLIRQLKSKNV